jgi:alcohol dehydrogenase, propanol-preferring
MRAAIVEAPGKVVIQDVPRPVPGPDEALVRITAAGVCHSDLHVAKGDWKGFTPPVPLGHEAIGIVEQVSPGAETLVRPGERVIMGLGASAGAYWCETCEYCLAGKTTLCGKRKDFWNAFGEYATIWAKALVRLPPEIDDREAPLACGGLTAYSAVKKLAKFGVGPGKSVAIVGAAGGVGHYAVQIAKAFGYTVVGVDMGSQRLEFVKSLGADFAVEAEQAEKFVKDNLGRANGCIVFSPRIAGFELGLRLLRRGGVFVIVGLPAVSEGHIKLTPLDMIAKDFLVMASIAGTVEEMRELVALAAAGKVKTHVAKTARLSNLNEVLGELEAGRYFGRAVIDDLVG